MAEKLADRQCVPCAGGVEPLKGEALEQLERELGEGWRVVDGHHLEKEFNFNTYLEGVNFVNEVAAIADEQEHHPDIYLSYAKVLVTLWTHKIGGLSENDFILAAKIGQSIRSAF
ncbi:MAG: 4a-hydroxytetrahydrobiopterin dehydratase [Candidatus Hydrogenedentes bacterium]|nr:4a-hydroxytetrahydrobiopterin dehydratase [Candidatus Hydrogenedentota bacterium]